MTITDWVAFSVAVPSRISNQYCGSQKYHGISPMYTKMQHHKTQSRRPASKWDNPSLASIADRTYVFECKSRSRDIIPNHFNHQVFGESKCWGRRPFLMRGAFNPDLLFGESQDGVNDDGQVFRSYSPWPSWADVVEIAFDDDAEARVISHIPGEYTSFDMTLGPLSKLDFEKWLSIAKNPKKSERKETLVVNDVDRFYPPLFDWIFDTFNFLPRWRMDDGQISLAEEYGGIGPHVDNYDVFLIQMSGTRLWQVGMNHLSVREEMDRTVPGIDVRILNDWGVENRTNTVSSDFEEWILNPGDLLYLPPRVAHCGTALSDGCMTLSVGCRAPSVSDLVSKLAEELTASTKNDAIRRYSDEDLLNKKDNGSGTERFGTDTFSSGMLTVEAKEQARRLVLESLSCLLKDDTWWDEFFGKYVTEQKRVRNDYPIPLEASTGCENPDKEGKKYSDAKSVITDVMNGRSFLNHAEGVTFAYSYIPTEDSLVIVHRLFVNGDMWQYESLTDEEKVCSISQFFKVVANHRKLNGQTIKSALMSPLQNDEVSKAMEILEELVEIGVLYETED